MTTEEIMNKSREAGKTYVYKPNPYKKGSDEYHDEQWNRVYKNVSHKTPLAKFDSIMKKMENELEERERLAKERKEAKKNKKSK